ncbi:cation-translocating P-type ATPase [Cellulomonas sp. PSBB021]|uniref:heavy metal translocating P-type ATPase n=1 Tax=Cellulomonas sp. PSBB021 TaxID=2003551 RepID=UPI000B8D7A16|nr:cation-translocating P-type ATPase [Cellulomonas sp. PSBB021]ASR54086.1 heavy metal translocating P-type ATPase [Cellulomonas sp. PSBB021]
MPSVPARLRSPWAVPSLAGPLVAAAVVLSWSQGVNPFGAHDEAAGSPVLVASDVLLLVAALVAGLPIAVRAVRALAVRMLAIDLLVTVAAAGALVLGELWEAAAVTWLFALGHALEAATLRRTRSALADLVAVAPERALVLRDGAPVEVPAESVRRDEEVLVKNGSRVPVDGVVVAGAGALDESAITGESIPAEKGPGDAVYAGTVSHSGVLHVRATGVGADTTLARIIHRVEEAQDAKAPTQTFMERFSAWYTPAVVVGAVLAGVLTRDVGLALTLLVIGCPGALVISIPVAVVAGVGRGARDGILVKGGEHLETAARVDAVALDKTGTLTRGRPRVTDVVALAADVTADEVLAWAARAEAGSEHPLAPPVLEAAAEAGRPVTGLPERTVPVPGKGVVAWVDGRRVAVGNLRLVADEAPADLAHARTEVARLAALGRTPAVVTLDGRVVGLVALADEVRPDAELLVGALHDAGITRVVMLTGDVGPVARAVASRLGVDEVRAELLPDDKLAAVAALRAAGHTVAMVGDGVNDAPALAAADVGVAMGAAGTAVAIETADVALMTDDLLALPAAVRLARRTVRVMRQNIAIAVGTVALLLAGVLAGGVTMAAGMLVHEVSVLVVIVNAMRLARARSHVPHVPEYPGGPRGWDSYASDHLLPLRRR